MSNAELIDSLSLATDMEAGTSILIRGQITWWDSMDGKGNGGSWTPGTGIVNDGRLRRDHMLSDVPTNYVRDRLMDYINTELEENKREIACAAVFPDLGPDELKQYSTLIAKKREELEAEELEMANRNKSVGRVVENLLRQKAALDKIEDEIDLTPRPGFHIRNYNHPRGLRRSVSMPGLEYTTTTERNVEVGTNIDRDCDQIRAMIKRFTRGSEWFIEDFRFALKGVSRPQLTAFLNKRGPAEGKESFVFQLAWELFKKRELLGLPLEREDADGDSVEYAGVLQERDGNRGKKRPSHDKRGEKVGGKRARTTNSAKKSKKTGV
ncbi:hypothetical protein F5X99DRAFT_380330 [Biscogniauxia marginata]|nr:hypothetical protein F5X99DRAFT_380330 [Biscogniauxia marginata]